MKFIKLLTFVVVILNLLTSTLSVKIKNSRHRHKIQPAELSFNPLPQNYQTGPLMNYAYNYNINHEVYNRKHLANMHTYEQLHPPTI